MNDDGIQEAPKRAMASKEKSPRDHARDVLAKFGNEKHTAEEFLAELERRGFTVHRNASPSGIGGLT